MRRVGFADDGPYVLWVCSALLPGTPPELGIFLRWASHLRRSSNAQLRDVPILLRPHPARTAEWASCDWRSVGNVVMFGGPPVDEQTREDYFESLYYSAAVVGITTTAFLDAAVVGRPVMSFHANDLVPEHEASLHFQYLMDAERGLLTMADSLEDHARQLAGVLAGPPLELLRRQDHFVGTFIRPRGIDISATSLVSDALEQLPEAPRIGAMASSALGRFGLGCVQRLERNPRWRHLILDGREIDPGGSDLGEGSRPRTRTGAEACGESASAGQKARRRNALTRTAPAALYCARARFGVRINSRCCTDDNNSPCSGEAYLRNCV